MSKAKTYTHLMRIIFHVENNHDHCLITISSMVVIQQKVENNKNISVNDFYL